MQNKHSLNKVQKLFNLVGELSKLWSELDNDEKELINAYMEYEQKKTKLKDIYKKL